MISKNRSVMLLVTYSWMYLFCFFFSFLAITPANISFNKNDQYHWNQCSKAIDPYLKIKNLGRGENLWRQLYGRYKKETKSKLMLFLIKIWLSCKKFWINWDCSIHLAYTKCYDEQFFLKSLITFFAFLEFNFFWKTFSKLKASRHFLINLK